jgi:hypothetical protein
MSDDALRLDGNTAGGMLGELFPFEMTTARTICATCGKQEEVGALTLYAGGPGTVMRCTGCESALIRLVHGSGRYWLDLRGVVCLEIAETRA